MLTRELLSRLFDAAYMQRWNDQIRPVELTELDKQAHKMVIAYVLGKYEEGANGFEWPLLIEAGIYEYLQRLVLTDLKPQVFYKIKEDPVRYRHLNQWVYSELSDVLAPLGSTFCDGFRAYLVDQSEPTYKRVLHAAHFFATKWEFDIIRRANPDGYDIERIRARLDAQQEHYYDLEGIRQLALHPKLRSFVDLCGLLRFQIRWSHVHRVPRTSVLGHMLVVAMLSYLVSVEAGLGSRRRVNNYFTGLFHDLPEALTRDIISPVKHSVEGLSALIKSYEREEMEEKVYPLVPASWHAELRLFTEEEFKNIAVVDGKAIKCGTDELDRLYDADGFNSRDGELIKAVDDLAAYMEVYLASENGIISKEMEKARESIKARYGDRPVGHADFRRLYATL